MIDGFLEWYRNRHAIRAVSTIVALLLLSTWLSCQEVKYLLFRGSTEATVYRVYEETTGKRNKGERSFVAMYKWQVAGEEEERIDSITESGQSSYRTGDKVRIDYLDRSSRLAGDVHWGGPIMLLVSLCVLVLAALPLIIESYRETRTR